MDWFDTLFNLEVPVSVRSLLIQEESLEVARYALYISFGVSVISLLGIGAAVWTAALTRNSVAAAREALNISYSMGRAWITHSDYKSGPLTDSTVNGRAVTNGMIIRISYKNSGQTPALRVKCSLTYNILPKSTTEFQHLLPLDRCPGVMVIAPNEERFADIHLGDTEAGLLRSGAYVILIELVASYQTASTLLGTKVTRLSYLGSYNPGSIVAGGVATGSMVVISSPLEDFAD